MESRGLFKAEREQRTEEAFSRILAEHGAAIGRVAASYARTSGDVDDLVQEITVALWRALPRFRGECSERTFVFRVAHNRAVSYLARRRTVQVSMPENEVDHRPDPEHALLRVQRSEALLAAVRRLPVAYRQVVTLVLEGLEYAEVASVLGISESNVGVRMNRGRNMLRELLEDHR